MSRSFLKIAVNTRHKLNYQCLKLYIKILKTTESTENLLDIINFLPPKSGTQNSVYSVVELRGEII